MKLHLFATMVCMAMFVLLSPAKGAVVSLLVADPQLVGIYDVTTDGTSLYAFRSLSVPTSPVDQ